MTVEAKQLRGGICVAVAAPDTTRVLERVQPVLAQVDVVEIRLDAMDECDINVLCAEIARPLLFTNRPTWEGGAGKDNDTARIRPLLDAVEAGVSYVDLELKADPAARERLLEAMHNSPTRLIISSHNFDGTPDNATLSRILREQINSGAHIGKIVTMAHDPLDVLRVLHLQTEARAADFPLIAFCMGEEGRLSRIATLLLGGFMTYAALDENQATAPGQLTVTRLKEAMSVLTGS